MHDITPRDVSFPNPKCNILMPFKIKMASHGESPGLKIQVVTSCRFNCKFIPTKIVVKVDPPEAPNAQQLPQLPCSVEYEVEFERSK